MNARERLAVVAEWLGYNSETMSDGLRNAFDALRLYDYAQAHPEVDEMADSWDAQHRIAALGYDPMDGEFQEAETTGADVAADAIRIAHTLIDSVAFVQNSGDSVPVLAALHNALQG